MQLMRQMSQRRATRRENAYLKENTHEAGENYCAEYNSG